MYIKSINIENVGCFSNIHFDLSPGINLIAGINGSGKTTALVTIYSMFQNEELFQYNETSESEEISQIILNIKSNNENLKIKKRYTNGHNEIVFSTFRDIEKISKIDRKKIFLWNVEEIFHSGMSLSAKDIKRAIDFMHLYEIDEIEKYEKIFVENRKHYLMSGGQQTFIKILSILSMLPEGSVLLMDEAFARIDSYTIERILNLMQKMNNIQFIISIGSYAVTENMEKHNILHLSDKFEYKRRFLTVNYRNFSKQSIAKQLLNLSTSEDVLQETKIIRYQINSAVDEEEKRDVEFKEIKGSNPCDTIVATAEIYIVAFLNSRSSGIGTIKWGIDNSGTVVGVNLSRDQRDVVRRKLTERLSQIEPYLSPDLVHINFWEIVDEQGKLIPELYIVEISVKAEMHDELFATSKNEVYMKTESGKRKLSAHEVQLELKARLERK